MDLEMVDGRLLWAHSILVRALNITVILLLTKCKTKYKLCDSTCENDPYRAVYEICVISTRWKYSG